MIPSFVALAIVSTLGVTTVRADSRENNCLLVRAICEEIVCKLPSGCTNLTECSCEPVRYEESAEFFRTAGCEERKRMAQDACATYERKKNLSPSSLNVFLADGQCRAGAELDISCTDKSFVPGYTRISSGGGGFREQTECLILRAVCEEVTCKLRSGCTNLTECGCDVARDEERVEFLQTTGCEERKRIALDICANYERKKNLSPSSLNVFIEDGACIAGAYLNISWGYESFMSGYTRISSDNGRFHRENDCLLARALCEETYCKLRSGCTYRNECGCDAVRYEESVEFLQTTGCEERKRIALDICANYERKKNFSPSSLNVFLMDDGCRGGANFSIYCANESFLAGYTRISSGGGGFR